MGHHIPARAAVGDADEGTTIVTLFSSCREVFSSSFGLLFERFCELSTSVKFWVRAVLNIILKVLIIIRPVDKWITFRKGSKSLVNTGFLAPPSYPQACG